MVTQNILELEVRLLILKYGYKRVIEALARVRNENPEKIEELINEIEQKKLKKTKPNKISVEEISYKVASEHPDKAPQIQQLAIKFDNKIFLPQLKDVRRFLEKQGTLPKPIKTRQAGAKQVFDVLGRLSVNELDELIGSATNDQSDFSILADQIIGEKPK